MSMIKGVNLGNWLVLEKWMSPELYFDTTAADETYFCMQLSESQKRSRLKVHRDHYITSRDFAYLASRGFNAVRLPVPFFLFEDVGPYVSCSEYVDKAFKWANDYGIRILLDLHTVPGSQSGADNGGLCGIAQWADHPERVDLTYQVLEQMALRYGHNSALCGIEVLNEPTPSDGKMARMVAQLAGMGIDLGADHKAVDQEAAKKNCTYDWRWLEEFYQTAYRRIRKYLPKEKAIVFHDGFDTRRCADWLAAQEEFENVVLDTHQYILQADWVTCGNSDIADYIRYVKGTVKQDLEYAQSKVPTIVGEWCLDNNAASLKKERDKEKRREYFAALADAQLEVYGECTGWFYWSLRTHLDDLKMDCWDAMKCVSNGWLPDHI